MSAQKSIATRPARSGVYRAPDDAQSLRKLAGQAGVTWFSVDLASVGEKSRFLAVCGEQLGFPQTFGQNWDALADCLQDFSWCPASGYIVHLRNTAGFSGARDWKIAVEILNDAASYWKGRGKLFVVLVDGAAELPDFAG